MAEWRRLILEMFTLKGEVKVEIKVHKMVSLFFKGKDTCSLNPSSLELVGIDSNKQRQFFNW